jgi:hypothetical protein
VRRPEAPLYAQAGCLVAAQGLSFYCRLTGLCFSVPQNRYLYKYQGYAHTTFLHCAVRRSRSPAICASWLFGSCLVPIAVTGLCSQQHRSLLATNTKGYAHRGAPLLPLHCRVGILLGASRVACSALHGRLPRRAIGLALHRRALRRRWCAATRPPQPPSTPLRRR